MGDTSVGGIAMKTMRAFKRILTSGVTANPEFMLRNLTRDTLHSWVVSHGKWTPFVDSIKGIPGAFREDKDMVAMMAAGASFQGGFAYGNDPAAAKKMVEDLMKKHGVDADTVLDTPKKLWDFWKKIGAATENAARLQRYKNVLADGGTPLQAAFEAKDVMDFNMRGDWAAIRFLAEVVPFLGARIQGLHKLGRGALENPKAFLVKGGAIALASVLLHLWNRDDDRYKELEEWQRDTYYHFWIGGEHFWLPKPFEVGAIFGTIPERITEYFLDRKDGKLLAERMKFMLTQTFSIGMPQIMAPAIEQWANKSAFTNRAIVGKSLSNLSPGEQRDAWTSPTASEIGKAINVSPKRIEHLINGYFGSLGMFVLGAADVVTRQLSDYPELPSRRPDEMPILKAFYRGGEDSPAKNTRFVTEFYEIAGEIDELEATVNHLRKQGDKARAKEMVDEEPEKWKTRKMVGKSQVLMRNLNKKVKQVYESRTMTPEEKRNALDDLTRKKNELAKRTVERVRAVSE
jgi:hypothetical protein